MLGPINVKSPNNISKWQMGFNSAFKGLKKAFVKENLKLFKNLLNMTYFHCPLMKETLTKV